MSDAYMNDRNKNGNLNDLGKPVCMYTEIIVEVWLIND